MINKRKCRKFANPGLEMQVGNGILHAQQVDYIIRTAVKIIDHHKTLILYVYSRTQAARGDFRPLWTVFQTKHDFITLARKEDGSTVWRTAGFNNLGDSWNLYKKCAFYSMSDEARLCRYFKCDSGSGLEPLLKVQANIQKRKRQERQCILEKEISNRMATVPSLPRGLKNWIHKSVMPAYFFYDYQRCKSLSGVCSSCGHTIELSGVKQGRKGKCPYCKNGLIMKPRSRRGYCMTDRDTCQVIQNMGNGELLIRIIKVIYTYKNDMPEIQMYENARQFVRHDENGKIQIECYYYQYDSGISTNWKKGMRPTFNQWQYSYEADTCGHLCIRNLPVALKNTPWQYCPIVGFYDHFHEPMQALPFLRAYLQHPRLEHLVKVGFCNIASNLAYSYNPEGLDETQNRTHRILKVSAEDVPFLKGLGVDLPTLKIFQKYTGVKDRQKLLLWQLEHEVNRDILPILEHITAHKFIRYMDSQYGFLHLRKTPPGSLRYRGMQVLVSEYRDYLDMCHKLGYDMRSSFILYPKDLQKAHDRMNRRLKHRHDARVKRDFKAVYQEISGKLDFEQDGMKIVYPATPDDVIAEGHALHHCVGGYVKRVAKHECVILFLRRCNNESQPYYTVEIRGKEVVQVRGMGNCSPTPEVETFIQKWEDRVLSTNMTC